MPTRETVGAADGCRAGVVARPCAADDLPAPRARFDFVCYDEDGNEKWRDHGHNVVTLEGKTLNLNVFFGATAKPGAWYILLAGTGTKAATDTLGTHAGWAEYANYTGTRPAITFGAATTVNTTGAQVTNTGGTAVTFAISGAGGTVASAGVCTAASGTTGTLWNVVDFTGGSRAVAAGDSLNVTISESFAA